MIKKTQDIRHKTQDRSGFSLTEVLLALGTLAVGMLFIAAVFPASINLTTIATERTIAATVAEDAFATIRLYGINLSDLNGKTSLLGVSVSSPQSVIDCVLPNLQGIITPGLPENEYAYPSSGGDFRQKKYYYSAVYRMIASNEVQVTVFVCRKTGVNQSCLNRPCGLTQIDVNSYRPIAIPIQVITSPTGSSNEIVINGYDAANKIFEKTLVSDGYTILDGATGRIQRVLERLSSPNDNIIRLDSDWQGGNPGLIWVVPPPFDKSRYPCIGVYQKVIRF